MVRYTIIRYSTVYSGVIIKWICCQYSLGKLSDRLRHLFSNMQDRHARVGYACISWENVRTYFIVTFNGVDRVVLVSRILRGYRQSFNWIPIDFFFVVIIHKCFWISVYRVFRQVASKSRNHAPIRHSNKTVRWYAYWLGSGWNVGTTTKMAIIRGGQKWIDDVLSNIFSHLKSKYAGGSSEEEQAKRAMIGNKHKKWH